MSHLELYTDQLLVKAKLNDLQQAKEELASEGADFPGKVAEIAAQGGDNQVQLREAAFRYLCLPLYELHIDVQLFWGKVLRMEYHRLEGVDITEEFEAFEKWRDSLEGWYTATAHASFTTEHHIIATLLDIHTSFEVVKKRMDGLAQILATQKGTLPNADSSTNNDNDR